MRIAASTLTSLSLAISLAFGSVAIPQTAFADDDPAAILGLDAEDEAAGNALTDALRGAFSKRGLSGGEELSLTEVRLTMGCENNEPACLSEAGDSLGVRRLVYGSLVSVDGGGYRLDLLVLDVQKKMVDAQTSTPLTADELAPENVDATANEIVLSLFPQPEDDDPLPPLNGTSDTPTEVDDPIVEDKPRSNFEWGRHKPTPKWKWAGFGTSIGLLVVGGAAGIAGAVMISNGGPLRTELRQLAEESLEDESDANDVDSRVVPDLCDAAKEDLGNGVRNAEMTKVCNRADGFTTLAIAGGVVAAVGALGTVVFTTLLFVKRKNPSAAALLRRKARLGASPTRGGMTVSGGFSF